MRALVILLAITTFSTAAWAETLDAAIQRVAAADENGLKILRTNDAEIAEVLTLERLPTGAYLVEVALKMPNGVARYPLKFKRSGGAWSLAWQPATAYASALVGLVKRKRIPSFDTPVKWAEVARMPSMPVIATTDRYVTPFGEAAFADRATEGKTDLGISAELVHAFQSWVKRALDNDPGPAGFDLILDGRVSWRETTNVFYNAAAVGMYHATIVSADFGALRVASPTTLPEGFKPVVVVVYALDARFGIRISRETEVLAGDGCAPDMTTCVSDIASFDAALDRLIKNPASAVFAGSKTLLTLHALPMVAAYQRHMELGPHKLLVGYVQQ